MIGAIVDEIRGARSFLISSHESPDGDAVGSSLAMANFLVRQGKEVTVYLKDPVPEMYHFLPLADTVVDRIPDREYDVCVVLDVGEFRRAGAELENFTRIGKFINLDHHLSCQPFGNHNLIDPEASATGALVYRIVRAYGGGFDYDTAVCIYTAVITDTGSFRYSNSNPEAFTIAGEMIAAGVNAWNVAEQLYESQPEKRLRLLGLVLATLDVSPRGDYASVTVTLDMYDRTGTGPELTDGFVNYPRSIRGVEVAILFREIEPNLYKVGFRSKGKVNVAEAARLFNGGGHHNAAGCTVAGAADEVKNLIFSHLERLLG